MALIYLGKMFKYFTIEIKRPTNSKPKTPVPVCLLRKKLRVNMLTSAKTGKQMAIFVRVKRNWVSGDLSLFISLEIDCFHGL